MAEKDDILQEARERFDRCVEAESNNRTRALDDLRFHEGDQWPDDVLSARKGLPCLTLNRTAGFVRQVTNDIKQNTPSIKCSPGEGGNLETAEVMNGLIRAIQRDSDARHVYSWAGTYAAKMGWGYWRVMTEYENDTSFDQIIKLERIRNPFTVYLDPDRSESDGSDAMYAFVEDYLTRKDFEAKYPKAEAEWPAEMEQGTHRERWYADDSVRVCEYWCVKTEQATLYMYQDGTTGFEKNPLFPAVTSRQVERRRVVQYLITGLDILETTEWPGRWIPIIEARGDEEIIEGELHLKGMVRDLIDPQRQYNYAQSSITERIGGSTKSPWVGPAGSFTDPKWKTANKKNHAYLEYELVAPGVIPQKVPGPDVSPGLVQQLMTASEDMRAISGIYNAGLGDRSNEVAGVAIRARQGESDVSNFHYMDNLVKSILHTGRILVDLIPKIYSGPRVISILQADDEPATVPVNQQFYDEQQAQNRQYDLRTGTYAVAVSVGPSFTTARAQASQDMLQFLQAFPTAGNVIGDLFAKAQDWPGSDEMAKRLKLMLPPAILANESPHIAHMMEQMQQQTGQMQNMISMLQQQIAQRDQALADRSRELEIKEREVMRKTQKDASEAAVDLTEIEAEHKMNVPGSLI